MPSAQLTINTAANPVNLWKALRGDTISGVTVSETFPRMQAGGDVACNFLAVENDYSNGAAVVTVGDGKITAGAGGTNLLAGSARIKEAPTNVYSLANTWVAVSANSTKVNVEFQGC